jgi:hypothetical protein
MLLNFYKLLNPAGHFQFLTPNGREDVWSHYVTWQKNQKNSELLINHVNYFHGQSLHQSLVQLGFQKVDFYVFVFKGFLKGRGWRLKSNWAKPSKQKEHLEYLRLQSSISEISKAEVYSEWYIQPKIPMLTKLYCFWKHYDWIRLPGHFQFGHELFGLYQKTLKGEDT